MCLQRWQCMGALLDNQCHTNWACCCVGTPTSCGINNLEFETKGSTGFHGPEVQSSHVACSLLTIIKLLDQRTRRETKGCWLPV